jgi:hypothetical protein
LLLEISFRKYSIRRSLNRFKPPSAIPFLPYHYHEAYYGFAAHHILNLEWGVMNDARETTLRGIIESLKAEQ